MSEINNRGDVEERLHTEITHLKSELEKCRVECAVKHNALLELKVRIAYIGMPQEAMWTPHDIPVPDWRKHIAILETALSTDCGQAFLDRLHTSEQRVKELVDLVCRLRNALVAWGPAPGDAFLIKEADTTLHKAIGEVGSK